MNLGNMEQRTKGMKKQAQELIEQAYNRGFNAGYEEGKGQAWSEEVKKYEIEPDKKNEYIEQGRNEAWEVAKKICCCGNGCLFSSELEVIFDTLSEPDIHNESDILLHNTASEAITKIKNYEEQKKQEKDSEIHVGDEVYISDTGCHGVVTYIYEMVNDKKNAVCITQNGTWNVNEIKDLHKTGRHFPEITEVLKKMKGE